MKYTFACKRVPLNDSIKEYAQKKISKLERYFREEDTTAFVTFSVEKDHLCKVEITIRGGAVEAVGGSNAAGIGDGAGVLSELDPDTPPSNPNNIIICGDAEVTAKAGSQTTDAKAPAIGGKYGEVPTENLSDDEHKVTGGRLTRLNADGTVMEGMATTTPPPPRPSRTTTRTTMMMTSRPRHRRTLPNPCPAAWWSRASFPAGSPSAAGPAGSRERRPVVLCSAA